MARDVLAELADFARWLEDWEMELSFDPDDPTSVEAAITAMEEAVDSQALRFPGNDPVMNLAEQIKEQYRHAVLAPHLDDGAGEAGAT
jgi:hypothetical protein